MELRIEIRDGPTTVVVRRHQWELDGNWTQQAQEAQRALDQALAQHFTGPDAAGPEGGRSEPRRRGG